MYWCSWFKSGEFQAWLSAMERASGDLVTASDRQATFESRMLADRAVLSWMTAETWSLGESQARRSATAGVQAGNYPTAGALAVAPSSALVAFVHSVAACLH